MAAIMSAKNDALQEAVAWIGQALELLDQAHANLKPIGLHCDVRSSRSGRTASIAEIVSDAQLLHGELAKIHFCVYPDCDEEGERDCECCNRKFCSNHCTQGGDRPTGPYGYLAAVPACCDLCRKEAL